MAEWTGLEPATSGVTGQHSNRLNYHSAEPGDDTEAPTSSQQTVESPDAATSPATRGLEAEARALRAVTASLQLVGAEGFEPPTLSV